ncbi:MAG: hypothetical protein Hyperionvirus4_87 [Hyperionvirus sp.]|uniref:Zinc-binding domain-containing protein n=1 Tax=Hyperionvirus sp. TaxID=2487770 RepID=A0A3G5A7W0_9VIRU|nr:MAG: hypothetical protein Hyperionvirus4_87 [Hyperionvirus sp.]
MAKRTVHKDLDQESKQKKSKSEKIPDSPAPSEPEKAHWQIKDEHFLDLMWGESISGTYGLTVICNVCDGGSRSFCICAKNKFINSITFENLQSFKEQKGYRKWREDYKNEIEEFWQYKVDCNNSLFGKHFQIKCAKCHGNNFVCECQKKKYLDTLTPSILYEYLNKRLVRADDSCS